MKKNEKNENEKKRKCYKKEERKSGKKNYREREILKENRWDWETWEKRE